MAGKPESDPNPNPTQLYEIRIKGSLDRQWAAWFEGFTVSQAGGETLLTGPVVDQAALHGLLRKVRDLGLPLISVTQLRHSDCGSPE